MQLNLKGMAGIEANEVYGNFSADSMDEDEDSSDITQKTVSFKDIESQYSDDIDEDEIAEQDMGNKMIRVYDARFKIPRHTNLAELEKTVGEDKEELRTRKKIEVCGCTYTNRTFMGRCCLKERLIGDVREIICFKKSVHIIVSLLMTISIWFTLALFIRNYYTIQTNQYFVARARTNVTEVIDFENVTTTRVLYFLFRNETEGANDTNADNEYEIVENVNETCEGGGYQLEKDMKRAINIRENIRSAYMMVSELFVMLLIVCCFILAVIYVPFFMKEHDIPIILRRAGSNVFFDLLQIRLVIFIYYMILTGSLPHLTMYWLKDRCLHTTDEDYFGINWTDYYQYCLTIMSWTMSIPLVLWVIASFFKDNFRYLMTPFLVANLVYCLCVAMLSFVTIIFTIIEGNSFEIKLA